MCIRDSVRIVLFLNVDRNRGFAVQARVTLGVQVEIFHVGDCLLYTSDAADERSSVALGGRRIIQKKKNTQTKKKRSSLCKYQPAV